MAKIFEELNRSLLASGAYRDWLPRGVMIGVEWAVGDLRGSPGKSLRVNSLTGVWKDFASGECGGDLVDLYAAIEGISVGAAAKVLGGAPVSGPLRPVAGKSEVKLIPVPESAPVPAMKGASHEWAYRDVDGKLLFFIARYDTADGKQFKPFSWDGARWVCKAWPKPRPLYGLELLGSDRPVLVVEGEKACDAARRIVEGKYAVITWSGGAQAWNTADWSPIYGRRVLIWPDADPPGIVAGNAIAGLLFDKCPEVKVLNVSDLKDGWDAADTGVDWDGFRAWAKERVELFDPKLVQQPAEFSPAMIPDIANKWLVDKVLAQSEKPLPVASNMLDKPDLSVEFPTMKDGFFHVYEDDKGKVKEVPDFIGMGKYLGEIEHLKTTRAFSYIFNENHYSLIDDLALKSKIDALTLYRRQPYQIGEFLKAVTYKNYCPDSFFEEPSGYINLQNGVLDVVSGVLKPNDGELFFKYVLPHKYDEAARCDRWLEFLDFVFEGNKELADLSAEVFGYILSGGVPWLHKAFFLDGSGRNGKSTWLEVLKRLIGKSNYCSIPMRNLDKPFSVVMADGKLANIVGELEGRDMSSEAFKIAVGGEELTAAHKGKPEYQLEFRAKLIFATNNIPVFSDKSAGNYERLCILPFKRYIAADERDPEIMSKLTPELAGILNWALVGLARLKARGKLPKIAAVEETLKEYRTNTDSVFQWAEEYVHPVSTTTNAYIVSDYYGHYADWCRREHLHPVGKSRFGVGLGREIKARAPNLLTVTRPKNKSRYAGQFEITASSNIISDSVQLDLKNRFNSYSD